MCSAAWVLPSSARGTCTCSWACERPLRTVHRAVHTGLSVALGPLWLLRTVANGAFSSVPLPSLPGWSSAIFCRHLTRSRGCGSPKCAKGSRRPHPDVPTVMAPEVSLADGYDSLFSLVRGLAETSRRQVFRGANDSLAPMGIGVNRLTVRLEHRSTDRQMADQPQWTDARPLWTPRSIRGTVVRCLN